MGAKKRLLADEVEVECEECGGTGEIENQAVMALASEQQDIGREQAQLEDRLDILSYMVDSRPVREEIAAKTGRLTDVRKRLGEVVSALEEQEAVILCQPCDGAGRRMREAR